VHEEGFVRRPEGLDQVQDLRTRGRTPGVQLEVDHREAECGAAFFFEEIVRLARRAPEIHDRPDTHVTQLFKPGMVGLVRAVDPRRDLVEVGPQEAQPGMIEEVEVPQSLPPQGGRGNVVAPGGSQGDFPGLQGLSKARDHDGAKIGRERRR
jgi:hypothetical protein